MIPDLTYNGMTIFPPTFFGEGLSLVLLLSLMLVVLSIALRCYPFLGKKAFLFLLGLTFLELLLRPLILTYDSNIGSVLMYGVLIIFFIVEIINVLKNSIFGSRENWLFLILGLVLALVDVGGRYGLNAWQNQRKLADIRNLDTATLVTAGSTIELSASNRKIKLANGDGITVNFHEKALSTQEPWGPRTYEYSVIMVVNHQLVTQKIGSLSPGDMVSISNGICAWVTNKQPVRALSFDRITLRIDSCTLLPAATTR